VHHATARPSASDYDATAAAAAETAAVATEAAAVVALATAEASGAQNPCRWDPSSNLLQGAVLGESAWINY
jgi:hypothetical protein